jgi:hypothetical protein
VPDADGRLVSRANAFGVSVAADAGERLLSRVDLGGGRTVGFGLTGARAGRGVRDRDELTYRAILPGVDLRLTSGHTLVKEDLILHSRSAGDSFVFPLTLEGVSASLDATGDVVFTDPGGVVRARIPTGWMEDANIDRRSGDGARSDGVRYALEPAAGGGMALRVTLDRAWLDDPARVFPVRVDPTVNPIQTFPDDTYVQSPFTNDYSTATELKAGTYNGGGSVARSFLHFDLSPWNGKAIDWARLLLWNSHSYSCTHGAWTCAGCWCRGRHRAPARSPARRWAR